MARRKPPERFAILKHAYSPGFFEPQRHVVAYPVKRGVQPCLIIKTQPNGRLRFVDALTIVPDDVRHDTPNTNQIYTCWLGVIANFYKADIERLANERLADSKEFEAQRILALVQRSEHRRPFRSARLHGLAQATQRLVDEWAGGEKTKPSAVTHQTWAEYQANLAAADCWYTQHLKVGEASESCVDQWRILTLWEGWEKKNLAWRDRAEDYLRRFPLKRQGNQRGAGEMLKLADAFEKRCRHIGLRKGKAPKRRPKISFKRKMIAWETARYHGGK